MTALEKLLKGEQLTEEEKNSLTPEELAEARKKELEAIEALRQERRRLEEKKAQQDADFAKKLVYENTLKAEAMAFDELQKLGIELTEEKKESIREMRKKIDSGAVTVERILDDFLAAAAAVERKTLIEDRKARLDFERQAAELTAEMAGVQSSSGGTTSEKKVYPQEVLDMVKEAKRMGINLTPEEAQKSLTKGLTRTY